MALCSDCDTVIPCHCHLQPPTQIRPGVYAATPPRKPAAAPRRPKEARPPTAYSDGKGRTYCLRCAPTVGADVPLTINDVDHWELCPSCGRHVVDVARSIEESAS